MRGSAADRRALVRVAGTYAGWIAGVAVGVVAAPALAAGPLYSEYISGDLPNVPGAAVPPHAVTTPGVTHVASGIVGSNFVDVDFITIVVPFATNRLVIDLDTTLSHQNSVLGVGLPMQYPALGLINDDDLDVADDALGGLSTIPIDSLVDVTGVLGSPLPANTVLTIAIGRTGEQSLGWNGTSNILDKIEYQLFVYTEVVPAPSAAVILGMGALFASRRRRGPAAMVGDGPHDH